MIKTGWEMCYKSRMGSVRRAGMHNCDENRTGQVSLKQDGISVIKA